MPRPAHQPPPPPRTQAEIDADKAAGRRLGWAIFGVVTAGALLAGGIVLFAWRSLNSTLDNAGRSGVQTVQAPTPDDHWHVAYGINVCGRWQAPLTDRGPNRNGIGTQGEGVIHVHPADVDVSGPNATFGVFADQVGMVLGDDLVRLPDGTSRSNGTDCDGVPASWRLVDWDISHPTGAPSVRYTGFATAAFTGDRHALTLAFLPDGQPVPRPETIPALDQVTDTTTTTTTRRPRTTTPVTPPLTAPASPGPTTTEPGPATTRPR